MRISHIIFCLVTTSVIPLHADTIVLKSGKKYEGRVISEDEKSYLLEIQVTKTIKDERRVPKNQIDEIIKETKEDKSFKDISKLVPTPDLLPASTYKKRVELAQEFVSKFPKSANIKEAKKILAQLEKEHRTIAAGGLKLDGQLISHSDMEANAYEIHARMLLQDIKKLAAAEKHHEALRKWQALKKDYKNSTSFQKGVPVAQRVLRSYQSKLKQLMDTLDTRTEKRKSALLSMNENDRRRTEAVLAEKQKNYAALVEREKTELQFKWLTVDPFEKESIDHNHRQTISELSTLSNIRLSEIKQAGPSYRSAWTALAEGNLEVANQQLQKLQTLQIPARYMEPLQKQLKDKQLAHQQALEKARQEAAAEKARQEKLAKEAAEKAAAEKKKKPRGKRKKQPANP